MENNNSKTFVSLLILVVAFVALYFLMKYTPSVSTENTIEAIQLQEEIGQSFTAIQELNPETGKIDFTGHYVSFSTPQNFVMEEQGPSAGKNHCALWEYIIMYDSTLPKITTEAYGSLVPPSIEVMLTEKDYCGGLMQPVPEEYKDTVVELGSRGVSQEDAERMIAQFPSRGIGEEEYGNSCKIISIEKVGERLALYADGCMAGPPFDLFYLVPEPFDDAIVRMQGISGHYSKETLLEISSSISYN